MTALILAAAIALGAVDELADEHQAPAHIAIASWYDEHGVGACDLGPDVQTGYRFASLILKCGTRVRFCAQRCVTAIMADHGPYVTGRTFDLNVNLRAALGCGGLCTVRWRVIG